MSSAAAATTLELRSDVGRALLANAGLFKTPKMVVWEYVANGLQYHDIGTKPIVKVTIAADKITIEDNGRGMDRDGLKNFFTLHGENQDRKQGKIGRGLFGTGKSAAFAIAGILRIETCRNGKRNVVELTKEELQQSDGSDRFPLRSIIIDEKCASPNGTKVIIEGFFKTHRKIDVAAVTKYIENLPYINNPMYSVLINGIECQYKEPEAKKTWEFPAEGEIQGVLGDVKLIVKAAYLPLDEENNGIKVISSGEVHAITLAGIENKELANYLFGEIHVAKLEDEQDPPAIDVGRSRSLNKHNPLVRALFAFINTRCEEVRLQLVEEKRVQQKSLQTQQFKKLEAQVSSIINEHFNEFRAELHQVKARGGSGLDQLDNQVAGFGNNEDHLVPKADGAIKASVTETELDLGHGDGEQAKRSGEPPELAPALEKDTEAGSIPASGSGEEKKQRPKGGFSVDHEMAGKTNPRTRYEPEKRIIWVNLEHPQLATALRGRELDDPTFKRLFYEVALIEYVFALMYERMKAGDYDAQSNVVDLLFEVREQINTITAKAAFLYE